MPFSQRSPALRTPPVQRASRWITKDTAECATTAVLRHHEERLRRSLALAEPFVDVRCPVSSDVGVLHLRQGDREGGGVVEEPVSSAVVHLDLSAAAPVVLAAFPESLDRLDGAWDLLQVLTRCSAGAAEHWDDPRAAVDSALAADPARAAAALAQWQGFVGDDPAGAEVADLLRRVTGDGDRPSEGLSWSSWAQWFVENLRDVAAGRAVPTGVATGSSRPQRSGEFDESCDVGAVVEEVLTVRGGELERWSHADGPRRTVVRADVGRIVGTVRTRRPELEVAASGVAVVLQRNGSGGSAVLDAYPEVPGSDVLRRRFPVAASLLPGYFGPGTPRLEVLTWPAQRALLTNERDHVVREFCRELDDLTSGDVREVGAAFVGLGAAVLPAGLRTWAQRLSWRSRRFDWRV